MNPRVEALREAARMEAAEREERFRDARKLGHTWRDGLPDISGRAAVVVFDRDPCPRCGVRGDIGCKHKRRAA